MPKIAVVFFSYRYDADELYHALRCIRASALPGYDYDIYVFDDAFAPMPDSVIDALQSQGVHYTQTPWERLGNIRGAAHLKGATRIYADLQAKGYAAVVKVDPDTAVLKQDWIATLLAAPERVCIATGFYSNGPQYAYGPAYAVRGDILQRLALRTAQSPRRPR